MLLNEHFEVIDLEGEPDDDRLYRELPRAFAVVGQPDLPAERLAQAQKLRAVVNIEGNFFPNLDYAMCHERLIHVLNCGPAVAQAVGEYGLGLALDAARAISRADREFRRGEERYGRTGSGDAVLLGGAPIALIGFGNIGRELWRLLQPFHCIGRIYDPWLPDSVIREAGATPATLEEALANSTFVFITSTATDANTHLVGATELDLLPENARLILLSRAAVVDFEALLDRVESGRLVAALDVWPEEPVAAGYRARGLDGVILSAHRAGGIPQSHHAIGDYVLDDLVLISRGLSPVRMQRPALEVVARYRNRPVDSNLVH
jgi:Phosphoglycerate dehydrogenase and related dehydrogenases